jgi:hypothetical protein
MKVDFRETEWKGMDWMHVGQNRNKQWILVSTVMKLQVSKQATNFLTKYVTVSFSMRILPHGVSYLARYFSELSTSLSG